ncbi:MAG: PAS domain S-box protein, partial [Candidatus Bathyarchaeota archaeon]|nr:PAS domain S-box protein [Candidatus Bathyarchaeota archaeon]
EHVIGKVCHTFICPAEKGKCPITDLGQTVDKSERVLLRADGQKIPILKTVTTIIWGGRKYLIESLIDITELKKTEKTLQKSEERFRALMEEAPISIFNTDLKGKITYVNKRFEESIGYSREEIVGKDSFKLGIMSDETLKLLVKRMKERLMGKTSRLLEGRFKRKDGEWIWAEVEGRLIKKFGVPVGFQLTARDITDRKIAEEERKHFEERLSILHTYSRDLNTAENIREIYRLTLDAMQTVLGFEYADFFMIDKNMLCIVDQHGYPKPFPLELPLDGSKKGISIKAVKTGNSVLVQDVRKDIDFVEGLPGVLSELAVPIKIGQKILGVLNVESKELNAFDEKDQELLEILASHAATAMSNLEFAKNLEMHAREIRESKEKFERLFMDNPEAAVYMDSNFHILDINPRFFKLFGYTLNEVRGKHINDIVVPKDKMKEGEKLDKKALKGYINYDTFRKRKDGTLVPVSVSVAPITVEGKLTDYITVYTDITERKRYEERLSALNIHSQKLNMAESMEEIYRLTMDAVEKTLGFEIAFFMVVDKDMLCLVDHRGYPESFSIKLPLDGTKKGVSVKVVKTGKSINVSDAEKEDSWVEFMPSIRSGLDVPVKVGGKVLGVIGVDSKKLNAFSEKDQELLEILASHAATAISNLDRAKNLEAYAREIRESQQKFERLFTDNPEAAVYMDSSFHILDINPRFSELFGYSSGEVRGKHINDGIVPKDKMEEGEMLDREALKKGYVYHDTVRKRKNGSLVPVSISAAPITVEGKLVGIVGLYKDITERKQMEKKLEEYSQHLEELVEKRTRQLKEAEEQLIKSERLAAIGQVAAMVGHDLRNPLTSIKGATYYLKKKLGLKMDEKAMEMLELVEKDVEHSNEIITDLMEYSKEIRLELTETTPKSIVRDALSLIEVSENIQILDLTQSAPKIEIDAAKTKRVFGNLIKNAIDAMPIGGKLAITSKESNANMEITFADTGIGMTKEIMEKIWTPFFTTKAKGMGLGLAICKRIIEAHGGSISVESTVGKGTTFTVTIPIKPKIKDGGEKTWVNVPESLLSTTTKA